LCNFLKISAREEKCVEKRHENPRSRAQLHNFCACGKTVHEVLTELQAFAHFSLAPCAPIGDNPALSHSGDSWAGNSWTGRAGRQGLSKTFRRGHPSRSLIKNESGPAFHSLFTSVEIAGGMVFSYDDYCNPFLGQIS
jgi:hypothetical protein